MTKDQQEARTERIAIMECEKVPPAEIAKVLKSYPHLYGIEDEKTVQGSLILCRQSAK